ncbi:MAG: hypothetical protein II771_07685, partial [Clostridia bacterium]|nr:hypothetical protein [Clostridia bacterium]
MKKPRALSSLLRLTRAGPEERPLWLLLPPLFAALVYGAFNAFLAYRARSSWFGLMSAYHFLLFFTRLYTVLTLRTREGTAEARRILLSTGASLLATDAILGAAVSLLAAGAGAPTGGTRSTPRRRIPPSSSSSPSSGSPPPAGRKSPS